MRLHASSKLPGGCPFHEAAASIPLDDVGTCPHARELDGSLSQARDARTGGLVLVGVNHHTAPVSLRERFYHDGDLSAMLDALRAAGLAEAAVLFTCNRFEVYGIVGDGGADVIVDYLADRCGLDHATLEPSLYRAEGEDAALHLMRVAAGLESLVLGEPQILGQVADALAYGQGSRSVGPNLSRLFTSAIHAGKRARTETDISRHTQSISHAGVLLVKQSIDLATARVLVLGAGEMAGLAVDALKLHGATNVCIINRTASRGAALAERMNVGFATWDVLPSLMRDADAVIAATSSPTPLLHAADFAKREGRPLELVDLAVPRNVAEDCDGVPGLRRHDVDSLQQIVETHRIQRQREATRVEELLAQELAVYLDWVHSREVTPLIADLRRRASEVVDGEVELALRRLPQLDAQGQAVIEQMAHRIVGKLLHTPTTALKSRTSAGLLAQAVRSLFGLPTTVREPAEVVRDAR